MSFLSTLNKKLCTVKNATYIANSFSPISEIRSVLSISTVMVPVSLSIFVC